MVGCEFEFDVFSKNWINLSMTHDVQMYRKPYDGFKIQDTCFGNIMMIMTLKLVKGKTEYEAAADTKGLHLPRI